MTRLWLPYGNTMDRRVFAGFGLDNAGIHRSGLKNACQVKSVAYNQHNAAKSVVCNQHILPKNVAYNQQFCIFAGRTKRLLWRRYL